MSDYIRDMLNKTILDVEDVHDYVQIRLSENSGLNIYNKFSMIDSDRASLPGRRIASVRSGDDCISIFLSPKGTIRVSIKDADFRGPEAMEYVAANGARVIWP